MKLKHALIKLAEGRGTRAHYNKSWGYLVGDWFFPDKGSCTRVPPEPNPKPKLKKRSKPKVEVVEQKPPSEVGSNKQLLAILPKPT